MQCYNKNGILIDFLMGNYNRNLLVTTQFLLDSVHIVTTNRLNNNMLEFFLEF